MSVLGPLRVEGLREYPCGGPIHVAVEAHFDPPPAVAGTPIIDALDEQPRLELLSPSLSLGYQLWDATGASLAAVEPRSGAEEPEAVPSYTLAPGERRRVLVELAERLPALAPGRHRLVLSYEAEGHRCHSDPFELVLREPLPSEQARTWGPARGESWSRWSLAVPEPGYVFEPIAPDDPARFCRIVRELVSGPSPLSELDPARLHALAHGLFAPEHQAITVELAVARGPRPDAEALARETERRWPGLRWWLEEALAGAGPITAMRELLGSLR